MTTAAEKKEERAEAKREAVKEAKEERTERLNVKDAAREEGIRIAAESDQLGKDALVQELQEIKTLLGPFEYRGMVQDYAEVHKRLDALIKKVS